MKTLTAVLLSTALLAASRAHAGDGGRHGGSHFSNGHLYDGSCYACGAGAGLAGLGVGLSAPYAAPPIYYAPPPVVLYTPPPPPNAPLGYTPQQPYYYGQ